MGCLSLVWCFTKIFLVCLVITLLPGIPPHTVHKEFNAVRPKPLDAELLEKSHLDKAERLFEGKLTGPEAFAVYNGQVYTGIHGGFVIRIVGDEFEPVVKFGKDCEDISEEHICGRPLGLKFDAAGNLYVADAYYGLFKYNVHKGEKSLLVSPDEVIDGKKSAFINNLAVAKDGSVYFTVSSTSFPLHEGVHAIFAPGDGRVVKFDPRTNKASVVAEGLLVPNGIALSLNEDFLVVAETAAARVVRIDLKGSKAGSVSIFAEGLPGLPDNIRADGLGGFYVPLVSSADDAHPALPLVLGPFPLVRKFLSRLMFLLELPFVQINNVYPNYFCRRAAHMIGHFGVASFLTPNCVTILHLNSEARIIDALNGRDGSVNHVSDMIVAGDYILLGSPYNNYIARVPRPNAPNQVHIKSVRYEEITPEEKKKDELAAQKAADEARARKVREEQARKSEEAAKVKRAAAEVEEAKKRAAEEAKAKKVAEEAAKKAAEEAKARKVAEENAKRAAEEAKARKLAEEARAKKHAEEAKARKAAEEAKARKVAEELKLKKAAEESAKKKAAAEENKGKSGNTSLMG
ncbi:hypothetical protein ONE63_006499 [Megalurothrips usitatus]|uniref:Strictosidine synthase conserved region domain-containing protein n=1 Tax=Megalurothrips usitatus TaxID=439358 RepID=A0AAV7Y0Z1_9NEOP|nr:hypothetical protein ONE63_006499 [Megalurothrips usitatus]